MLSLVSDSVLVAAVGIPIAAITIVPATLTAYWSREAKKNSAEAKVSAAAAAGEVLPNGGMSSPVPNINDHIQYQTEMLEKLAPLPARLETLENNFREHVRTANYMGRGMAEVYLKIMGHEPPMPELEMKPAPEDN